MRRLFYITGLALAVALGAIPGEAVTEPAPPGPGRFVEDLADRALDTLTSDTLSAEERNERFRVLFNDNFDVPAIGRFVLGRYWNSATEPERQEFLGLFEEMVVRTYASSFGKYSGETFRVSEVRDSQGSDAIVLAEIVRPDGGPPIRLDWRVRRPQDLYKVVDVAVEGVSMALTQRSEFSSVIQRSGGKVEGLIEALRKKIEFLKKKDREAQATSRAAASP